jgi:hypothetical protein
LKQLPVQTKCDFAMVDEGVLMNRNVPENSSSSGALRQLPSAVVGMRPHGAEHPPVSDRQRRLLFL